MDFPATIGNTIDLLASPEARRKAKTDTKIAFVLGATVAKWCGTS